MISILLTNDDSRMSIMSNLVITMKVKIIISIIGEYSQPDTTSVRKLVLVWFPAIARHYFVGCKYGVA